MLKRFVTLMGCSLIALCIGADKASFGSRHFLSIEGQSIGGVRSIAGGGIFADVVADGAPAGAAAPKRLGPVQYEDITVEAAPLGQGVAQLVQAMLSNTPQPRNGSVVSADANMTIVSELKFNGALLTEFSIPALDGSSKDPGYFTLRYSPASATLAKGGGSASAPKGDAGKDKAWMTSQFRLEIGDLPCNRVARMEPLTVTMSTADAGDRAGGKSGTGKQPGSLQLPNIRLAISAADEQAWQSWADDFLAKGNNGPAHEKNGAIVLLAANMKDEMLRFNLYNVGIARYTPTPRGDAQAVKRFAVELYVERMEVAGAANGWAAPQAPVAQAPAAAPGSTPPPSASAAPAPIARVRQELTREMTRAATAPAGAPAPAPASEAEAYVIKPNARLAKDVGRLVVRFPDGTRGRDNQRVQFPEDKDVDKNHNVAWGSNAKEAAPGEHLVRVNNKLVEAVKVQAGADTVMRLGVLRLDVPANQPWEVVEEDLDSAPALASAGGPADVGLPVGAYYVRTKSEITPVTIEDGKFAAFPPATGATGDAAKAR